MICLMNLYPALLCGFAHVVHLVGAGHLGRQLPGLKGRSCAEHGVRVALAGPATLHAHTVQIGPGHVVVRDDAVLAPASTAMLVTHSRSSIIMDRKVVPQNSMAL